MDALIGTVIGDIAVVLMVSWLAGALARKIGLHYHRLSVNIGALGCDAFVVLAIVVTVACAGKLAAAYPACRLGGLTPRESAGVASLMNTRGLTELIAPNVGAVPRLATCG